MAVKVMALAAIMYAAAFFMKNNPARLIALYIVDAAVLAALYAAKAPQENLAYFAACGFIFNSIIFLIPADDNAPSRVTFTDYLFMSAAIAIAAAYTLFFNAFGHGTPEAIPPKAAHPAVFMAFCAVFTAVYFIIKERPEAAENE